VAVAGFSAVNPVIDKQMGMAVPKLVLRDAESHLNIIKTAAGAARAHHCDFANGVSIAASVNHSRVLDGVRHAAAIGYS
jgi:hypothetical protein